MQKTHWGRQMSSEIDWIGIFLGTVATAIGIAVTYMGIQIVIIAIKLSGIGND